MTLDDITQNDWDKVPLDKDLEKQIRDTIDDYVEQLRDKAEGCGCFPCVKNYQFIYDWYNRVNRRKLQPEIDDKLYAHSYDWITLHLAEFPEDDWYDDDEIPYAPDSP